MSLVFLCLGMAACRQSMPEKDVLTGVPEPGVLYSLFDGEGGYRLGKVVAVESDVIFIQLFQDRWTERPSAKEVHKATKPLGVAYKPQSFTDMRPVRVEKSTIAPNESEAFENWKQGGREIF